MYGIMQYKNVWKLYMMINVTNVYESLVVWMNEKMVIDNAMYKSMKVHGRMVVKEWMISNVNKTKKKTKKMWGNTF